MVFFCAKLEIYHWKNRNKEINGKDFKYDLVFTIEGSGIKEGDGRIEDLRR